MAITGIALVQDLLKNLYEAGLRNQLNYEPDPLIAQLDPDPTMIEGDNVVMVARYGRQGGVAALATDVSDLPSTNSRQSKQLKFNTKNLVARIMLSDKAIEASRSNDGAFTRILEQELEDSKNDAVDDLSRQVYGDGFGKLAMCAAVTAVAVLGVDDVKYLAEGMIIDIRATNNTLKTGALTITAVDDAAKTITVNANVTTLTTDYITRAGNYGAELTGLDAVFTPDTTLYGLDRSANKWFNPQRINHAGEVTETIMLKAVQESKRLAGGKVNYISTTDGIIRAFFDLQEAKRRNVNYLDLKGGFRAMAFETPQGAIALSGAKYAPTGKMRFLDLSNWHMAVLTDWGFMDRDGNMLSRMESKVAYQATLRTYRELACDKPRGQVDVYGITEH